MPGNHMLCGALENTTRSAMMLPPVGISLGKAKPEERQDSLQQNGGRANVGALHHHRCNRIWQHMAQQDFPGRCADRNRGFDIGAPRGWRAPANAPAALRAESPAPRWR